MTHEIVTASADATMPEDATPQGYCPHCDYPIDPGLCPECGQATTADRLRRTPCSTRLRRRIKQIAMLIAVIGVGIGSYRSYMSNIWIQWLPTSVLLWTPKASCRMNEELVVRRAKGLLSQTETDELLQRTITISTRIESPRPVSRMIEIEAMFDMKDGIRGIGYWIKGGNIAVDGIAVSDTGRKISTHCVFRLDEPLGVGPHVVTGTIEACVNLFAEHGVPSFGYDISVPISFRHEFVVNGKPASHYVAARHDDFDDDLIRNCCYLAPDSLDGAAKDLLICAHSGSLRLAGVIEARLSGREAPISRAEVVVPYVSDRPARIPLHLPSYVARDNAKVDIRFTPDPLLAYEGSLNVYFGGIIEWNNVTIAELAAEISASDCKPHCGRRPDAIREWSPEAESGPDEALHSD